MDTHPQAPAQGFDHQTHIRNRKTGNVESTQHYRLVVTKTEGKGAVSSYERPPGSNIFFHANGEMDAEKSREGLAKKAADAAKAAEAARVAALSPEDRAKYDYEQAQKTISAYEAKLKADKAPVTPVTPKGGA